MSKLSIQCSQGSPRILPSVLLLGMVNSYRLVKNFKHISLVRLKRGDDGKFADADIAKILHDATDAPAGSFRGQGTPSVLRIAEIMGIEQSRQWGLCTMNEFRKFLGLRRAYSMFCDIYFELT